jgi:hypothetical protein
MRGCRTGRALGVTALIVAGACGAPGGPRGTENEVTIRMMNTATAAALDLLVGGQVVAGAVQYEQASAPVRVPGGNRTLAVRESGATTLLASRSAVLTAGSRYTIMVSGTTDALVLTPSVVADTGLARPDRANLRIINVSTIVMPQDSSSLPPPIPLDVYITAPGTSLTGAASQLSLDARVSSYSSLLYFDPGSYVVRFVTPGTTTVVAETAAFSVAAGQVRAITLQRQGNGTWKTSVVAEE